jgi:hypothetical protein
MSARACAVPVKKRRPVVRENHGPRRKKEEGERGKGFQRRLSILWVGYSLCRLD